jgi:cytidine deaminase
LNRYIDHINLKPVSIMQTDELFVAEAKKLIKNNFFRGKHHVACVLEGKLATYFGLHVDTAGIDICAEPVAISNATLGREEQLIRVVSVYYNGADEPVVITPCGNCRQILLEHCPGVQVLIELEGHLTSLPIEKLLPNPYIHP